MADEEVNERFLPCSAAPQDGGEPGEKDPEPGDLRPPPPAATAVLLGLEGGLHEVGERVGVKVEAGEGEHDVEELVLERD